MADPISRMHQKKWGLRLYFDLAGQEKWHRIEWERQLDIWSRGGQKVKLVSAPDNADFVVSTSGLHDFRKPWPPSTKKSSRPGLVWDAGDFPSGNMPGLYCSLPRFLFDSRSHRSFCYPIIYNELIEKFDQSEATKDWSFVGGVTSGLRQRLIKHLSARQGSRGICCVQSGPWSQMFDRSGVGKKKDFAESIRRSKFILCPRGNGVGSIRLFETLKAGRVPVIISNGYVLPSGIEWDKCAIRVRENNLHAIESIVDSHQDRWSSMAMEARLQWESNYGNLSLLDRIGEELQNISEESHVSRLRRLQTRARATAWRLKGSALSILVSAYRIIRRR